MGQNVSSLEHGNGRVLPNAPMPIQCLTDVKVNFEKKKFGSSRRKISVSCTSQEYDNVTTPYRPIFAALLFVK